MPSSSTRSTYTELRLIHLYRVIFSRLVACRCMEQAAFISDKFSELLDISKVELNRTLKPTYDAEKHTEAGWKADIKQWTDLQTSNAKLRQSSKFMSAGNALADVGAELFRTGRNEEAAKFCGYGDTVWEWSLAAYAEEERFKTGGDYYSDVEMEY